MVDERTGSARRPSILVFDVNETLSDMSPMGERFAEVGAPAHLAKTWFAGVLRDGFALTAAGASQPFADIASVGLRGVLTGMPLDSGLDDAVGHVMSGFAELDVHDDVREGIAALAGLGIRLVTLSNGAASVAEALFQRAGVRQHFEALLSVEQTAAWKPDPRSYAYALEQTGTSVDEAMLVAVHPWDIDGAARAGLRTAWIDRAGTPYPDYFTAPDLAPRSLVELAESLA